MRARTHTRRTGYGCEKDGLKTTDLMYSRVTKLWVTGATSQSWHSFIVQVQHQTGPGAPRRLLPDLQRRPHRQRELVLQAGHRVPQERGRASLRLPLPGPRHHALQHARCRQRRQRRRQLFLAVRGRVVVQRHGRVRAVQSDGSTTTAARW